MKGCRRLLFLATVAVVVLYALVTVALSRYDQNSKQRLLGMIARELSPDASIIEMDDFMQRHTARHHLDLKYNFEFAGVLPQSGMDRIFFDREVQVILKVNKSSRTFKKAEIRIYYSFL